MCVSVCECECECVCVRVRVRVRVRACVSVCVRPLGCDQQYYARKPYRGTKSDRQRAHTPLFPYG